MGGTGLNCVQSQLMSVSPEVHITVNAQAQMQVYNPEGPPDYWLYRVTLTGSEVKTVASYSELWNSWNPGELCSLANFTARARILTDNAQSWILRGIEPPGYLGCAGRAGFKGWLIASVQMGAFTATYEPLNGGPPSSPSTHQATLLWDGFQTNTGAEAGVGNFVPLAPGEPGYPGVEPWYPALLPIGGFYRSPVGEPGFPPMYWETRWAAAPSAQHGFIAGRGSSGLNSAYDRANIISPLGYGCTLVIHPAFTDMDFEAKIYEGETVSRSWGSVQIMGLA
jgi:hypothetical protein